MPGVRARLGSKARRTESSSMSDPLYGPPHFAMDPGVNETQSTRRKSDDRFCGHCGGMTCFQRSLEGDEVVSWLWCWKCLRRVRVAGYPAEMGVKEESDGQVPGAKTPIASQP